MVIPDWPETAKFITEEERAIVIARLADDVSDARMDRLDKPAAKRVFANWKIYVNIVMYMSVVNSSYSLMFFTPTILSEMGYKAEAAQVRSIPIFVVAAVASIATAAWSDRLRHRFGFVLGGILTATAGYAVMLNYARVPVGVKYAALFLVASGGFLAHPVVTQRDITGNPSRRRWWLGLAIAAASSRVISTSRAKTRGILRGSG